MASDRNLIRFDWAMKRLLRNKANFVVLEGFLSELLGYDIKISSLTESEGNKENRDDKFNKVDIVAESDKGEVILIELQINKQTDYLLRMLYGVSKAITERIYESDDYAKIRKVFSVNIVFFDLGHGKDYVYHGVTDFTGIHYNDTLELSGSQRKFFGKDKIYNVLPEYYVIKVEQFDNLAKDTLDEWIYYFKNNEIPENFKAKGLKEARKKLNIGNMSKEEKAAYYRHLENLRIENSVIQTALTDGEKLGIEKGIEKGKVEGRAEGKAEGRAEGRAEGMQIGLYKTGLESLRNGFDAEMVSKITKLSVDTIEKLKRLLEKYGDKAEDHFGEIG